MALSSELLSKLQEIVGKDYVYSSLEKRIAYSFDATFQENLPDVIVKPHTVEEISAILQLANQTKTPLTPRGAGTGLSGGAVPMKGGIILEMTAFNRVLELNQLERYIVVEPGVITNDLAAMVDQVGLFYPPDPASGKSSTIGGNIAECAGGARGVKYGVTKDYVLELEIILPTGELITVGNRIDGESGWLDLPLLFTGSEGTLGIVTKIVLRLIDKPQTKQTALAKYGNLDDAARTVSAIISSGIIPTTIEIMDQTTLKAVENFLQIGLDTEKQAYLLLEVDGYDFEVERQLQQVAVLCEQNGAVEVNVAQNKAEQDELWQARRSISGACGKINPTKIGEDVTVPRSEIPAMIKVVQELANKYDLKMVVFGHAGDGNLHPNILTDKRNTEEMKRVEQAIHDLFVAAVELGGTLSGEHGVGYMKAPYLKLELGEAGYNAQLLVKRAFDPAGYLNPQKMFI